MGFFAPEMMDYNGEKAYSSAVDFWSFGCLAFELLNCDQAINYVSFVYVLCHSRIWMLSVSSSSSLRNRRLWTSIRRLTRLMDMVVDS